MKKKLMKAAEFLVQAVIILSLTGLIVGSSLMLVGTCTSHGETVVQQ